MVVFELAGVFTRGGSSNVLRGDDDDWRQEILSGVVVRRTKVSSRWKGYGLLNDSYGRYPRW